MSEPTHTILVVDDQENNRDLIRRRLERAGYRVLLAEDGPQALKTVDAEAIDLVVLDVMMPGLSGIEVLQILRKTRSGAELPVIMATAKDQSEDMVEALSHGANDYVTKPLDFPVVLARVKAQLRTREAMGETASAAINFGSVGVGTVLAGKYRLEEALGAGNFGAVYRATHLDFEQPVAVKILQTPVDDTSKTLERFRQEGSSAFRLKHPNVVSVLDFSFTSGVAYLVMELLEGHNLAQELQQRGQLSAARCVEVAVSICAALADAHGLGIIHRDIKPANIFLHRTRHGEVVKVLDFGIAKLVGEAAMDKHLTLDEGILGTPAFMAPERISGGDYDGRSDVYSLGIVLYQLLAGQLPFRTAKNEAMAVAMMHITTRPQPLRELRPDLAPAFEGVVMSTLRKDPALRPTAADLARNLRDALAMEETTMIPTVSAPFAADLAASEAGTVAGSRLVPPRPAEDFELPGLLDPPPGGDPAPVSAPVVAPREIGEPWT